MHGGAGNYELEEKAFQEELDISLAERKIWLVKVPQFLYDKWEAWDKDSMDMGKVSVYPGPTPDTPKIALELPTNEIYRDVPKQYSLNFVSNETPTYIFSEDNEHHRKLQGKVEHECFIVPELNQEYKEILRGRRDETVKPRRAIQLLGHEGTVKANLLAPVADIGPRKKKLLPEERRERVGRDEMLMRMFEAFEKYTYWTVKGLTEHTEQSTAYVKEMLTEIGQYVRKGPRKGMYTLKPEYMPHSSKDNGQMKTIAEVAPYSPDYVEDDEDEDETKEDMDEKMEEVPEMSGPSSQ